MARSIQLAIIEAMKHDISTRLDSHIRTHEFVTAPLLLHPLVEAAVYRIARLVIRANTHMPPTLKNGMKYPDGFPSSAVAHILR